MKVFCLKVIDFKVETPWGVKDMPLFPKGKLGFWEHG